MSESIDKQAWMARYVARYRRLEPNAPCGQLSEVAETYWFYLRHCDPEVIAQRRAAGYALLRERSEAWVDACSEALRRLEPAMTSQATQTLAQQLWDADRLHVVDPYVMANALSEQLDLSRMGRQRQP